MATKSTYIIAFVDYFCITDGLISKTKNILRLYNEWTGFYLGFFVWGRRSELKLMVGGGSVAAVL